MPPRRIGTSWWADFGWQGKRYRKRSPVNSKSGAIEYEATLRQRLARGEPLATETGETFSEFSVTWFETHAQAVNKPSEQRSKLSVLRRHLGPFFGARPLDEITSAEVARFVAAQRQAGLSPKTINNHLTVLRKLLGDAEQWGQLERAPAVRALRTMRPRVEFLSPAECEQLLSDRTEPSWHAMALVAIRTGLRLGELFALRYEDADLERRLLGVSRSIVRGALGTPKGGRVDYVPMTSDLVAFFTAGPSSGLVFPRASDGAMHRSWGPAERALARMCQRSGLRKVTWHKLRHSFASNLLAADVPLAEIQPLLRHRSIATTMQYAHLAPGVLRAAIDRLEAATPKLHGDIPQPSVNHDPGATPGIQKTPLSCGVV